MLIGHCIVILKCSEPWTNKSNCLSCEINKGMQAKHNTVQVTLALHNCASASSSSVSYGKCDGWMKNLLALHTCSGIIKNTTTWSRKYSVYISVQKKIIVGHCMKKECISQMRNVMFCIRACEVCQCDDSSAFILVMWWVHLLCHGFWSPYENLGGQLIASRHYALPQQKIDKSCLLRWFSPTVPLT